MAFRLGQNLNLQHSQVAQSYKSLRTSLIILVKDSHRLS